MTTNETLHDEFDNANNAQLRDDEAQRALDTLRECASDCGTIEARPYSERIARDYNGGSFADDFGHDDF